MWATVVIDVIEGVDMFYKRKRKALEQKLGTDSLEKIVSLQVKVYNQLLSIR